MLPNSPSRRTFTLAAFITLGTLAGSHNLLAATPAENFVLKTGNAIMSAARARSVGKFRAVLQSKGAISTIAIFSLGPYRKKLPASRKREYYGLVAGHISKVFAKHSSKLAGKSISIVSSRQRGKSVIVKSKVKYPSGKQANVTWRLVKRGGAYKIFDVNVQGIWLASTQKTDFTSILKRSNGDINALFSYLKK